MVPVCVIGQTGDLRSIEQASVTSAASVTDSCRRSFSITWPIIRKRRRIQLDGGIYWCWPTKKWRLRKRNMEFLPMHQFLSLSVFILFPGNDNLSLFLHSHTFQYLFQATSILIIIPSLFFFLNHSAYHCNSYPSHWFQVFFTFIFCIPLYNLLFFT